MVFVGCVCVVGGCCPPCLLVCLVVCVGGCGGVWLWVVACCVLLLCVVVCCYVGILAVGVDVCYGVVWQYVGGGRVFAVSSLSYC